MTKHADLKARAIRRNEQRALAKPKLTIVPKMARKEEKRRTGLEWLLHKERINADQARAGIRYGKDYRAAQIIGLEPIKSCISGDTGGSSSSRTLTSHAVINTDTLTAIASANLALGLHPDLIATVEAVCGRQQTPREIDPDQRRAAEIETRLKIGLDLLVRHYRQT